MNSKKDLTGIVITLEINAEQRLFIAVHADGAINRMGNGQPDDGPHALCTGRVTEPLFEQIVRLMPDDFLSTAGVYRLPNPQGLPVRLVITLQSPSTASSLEFEFGATSGGIPAEVLTFVRQAIALTDPWYRAQQGR